MPEVARRLLSSVRSYDFAGRYGGEEFLLVLNNCDPTSAPARAEQMRDAIAKREVTTDTAPLQLTMGVGLLRSIDWPNLSAVDCLSEVDAALYAAKSGGRNWVRVALPAGKVEIAQLHTNEKVHRSG
jgi:diguanylate cyclase (GGDEF)-like protein